MSTSASTYQGPYVQSWPNNASHYGYVLAWTQTAPATTTVQATWSAELYIVTGSTYASGPVYNTSAANGNLSQSVIDNAEPLGGTITQPAMYPYTGPSVCSVVS